jgi:hypothetical protein
MLVLGTPLHVMPEVLGHASIAIGKDMYGHLLEGEKRAAAEPMSRALFGTRTVRSVREKNCEIPLPRHRPQRSWRDSRPSASGRTYPQVAMQLRARHHHHRAPHCQPRHQAAQGTGLQL